LLIEGDFIGQAQIAVAIPVVEECLANAVMTGWMAERLPRGESLFLKVGWVFDEESFRLLRDGYLCAIIVRMTVGKSRY